MEKIIEIFLDYLKFKLNNQDNLKINEKFVKNNLIDINVWLDVAKKCKWK